MKKVSLVMTFFVATLFGIAEAAPADRNPLPAGFVYVEDAVPGVTVDLRYATSNNFIGAPVDGYQEPHAILSRQAAMALAGVQAAVRPFGFGLKIFDVYRPQRAVDHFVRWGRDLGDRKTKPHYYPDVAKKNLFKEGYIAARSSHSRGSTVDLTLVRTGTPGRPQELDMGSPYDFFGPISWPSSTQVTPQQRANRLLLRTLMIAHGFVPYAQEWWHFTLANEPYPDTYFDFPIRGRKR